MNNPWGKFTPPKYIADVDRDILANNPHDLKMGLYPEPYIGNPNTSSVVFLVLNPGFDENDVTLNMNDPYFIKMSGKNLSHKSDFYYLDERLNYTGGYKWWNLILGPLIKEFSHELIRHKVCCIEYFPYHSVTYKNSRNVLPSQKYSFELVKQAIKDNKTIVVMRAEKLWLKAVPELEGYKYITLKNPRRPFISSGNMTENDYTRIKGAIKY